MTADKPDYVKLVDPIAPQPITGERCQFVWNLEHGGWRRCSHRATGVTWVLTGDWSVKLCEDHERSFHGHHLWEQYLAKAWEQDPYYTEPI